MGKRKVALSIVLAMLVCSLSVSGVLEPRHEVKAATSGTWEFENTSIYSTPSPWHVNNWSDSDSIHETFEMDFTHNGVASDLSTSFTTKGSGSYYTASSGYVDSYIDMDAKYGGPEKTYAGGATAEIPYFFTIREDYRINGGETYNYASCGELILGDILWELDDGSDGWLYIDTSTSGGSKKAFPEYSKSGMIRGTLPTGSKNGQTMTLTFKCTCGAPETGDNAFLMTTKYIYKWTTGASDDGEDATTIGEDTDDEDDIVVGQVQNVKLTNKKVKRIYISYGAVSGATGYQIQYSTKSSMSGAKSMNASVTKGYFKNSKGKKATFKLGKTYYVRVRAYAKDSSGSKVYGKWSAKKKVTIKK